jgi:hypothetical protein
MAELLGDHLRVLAGLQRHRRPAMPEIVEPDRRQVEAGGPPLELDDTASGFSGSPPGRVNTRP